MKFGNTILLTLLVSSIGTSTAKSNVHHRPSLRHLDSSDSDDEEAVSQRECELEVDTGSEVEFQCKSKTKSELMKTEDKIKYKVSYDEDGLKVKVKYEQEIETETPDSEDEQDSEAEVDNEDETESESESTTIAGEDDRRRAEQTQTTETEYEVIFDRLIEYSKPGGVVAASATSQAYNFDEDTIVNSIDLTNMSPFTPVTVEPNGDIKWQISTFDGVSTFFFTISPGGDGSEVTANKLKIDVDIKGYQWLQSASNMAVLADVKSGTEVDIDYEDDEQVVQPASVAINFGTSSIDTSTLRPFGEFTWARDALVYTAGSPTNSTTETPAMVSTAQVAVGDTTAPMNDTSVGVTSASIQVVATAASDESNGMAFSFVGPGAQMAYEIFWDPEAGIGYDPSGAFGFGLAGVFGTIMAAMIGTL